MNFSVHQIFLGQPVDKIKKWFINEFNSSTSWPTYTTLNLADGTTQTKEISGSITWQNIGVKPNINVPDSTLIYCQLGTNVTEIRSYTFFGCISLTSIDIPSSISSIRGMAFFACNSLISVSIPSSVTSINDQTFVACSSLTSIDIPNSVTSIGQQVFQGCNSLTSVSIPNSVTSIGPSAFYQCSSLTSLVFEGKTLDEITAMSDYPWGLETSVIKPGIS